MPIKLTIDASDLTKKVSEMTKRAKLKKGEVRKITNFWAKAAYNQLSLNVKADTKLSIRQVRKRMALVPKKQSKQRGLFYKAILVKDERAIVHVGQLKPKYSKRGRGTLTAKGKRYPGAYILPGYSEPRVYNAPQKGSVNLPNTLHDTFRKKGNRLVRLYGGKMNRDIGKLAQKRLRKRR